MLPIPEVDEDLLHHEIPSVSLRVYCVLAFTFGWIVGVLDLVFFRMLVLG
jgi:hypothetical protein